MEYKVGDKVIVYSTGRSDKVPGEVVVILSRGTDATHPVIVKHDAFGVMECDVFQAFTQCGRKTSGGEVRLEHAPEYRYSNIYVGPSGNAATPWYEENNPIMIASYSGTLRCIWKDGKPTDIEFSKDGKFD